MRVLPILQKTNHIVDLDAANEFQRKHTPAIEVEKEGDSYKLTVKMGTYVPHPNDPDHFFDFFIISVDDIPVARFSGAPGLVAPEVSFVLAPEAAGRKVAATVSCTLHGTWKAEVEL